MGFTRTGILIDRQRQLMADGSWEWQYSSEQRTLRGRIVGIPTVTWKKGSTDFTPWPILGAKRYSWCGSPHVATAY